MSKISQNIREHQKLWEFIKAGACLILLIGLMIWLSGALLDKVEPGPPRPKPKPPSYTTQKVGLRSFQLIVEQVGNLRTRTEALVASRIMAQVKEIFVKENDAVQGKENEAISPTILAQLDDREIRARLEQAQAQLKAIERAMETAQAKLEAAKSHLQASTAHRLQAVSDFRRYQDLYKNKAATGQQLDQARAQKEIAEAKRSAALKEVKAAESELRRIRAQKEEVEAGVREARIALTYTVIEAPFTGRVVKKLLDVGDMASPGQPLFLIEVPSQPELYAFVSDSLISRLTPGQKLDVRIDALGQTLQGTLLEIVPKSDPSTRTVLVKVALPPIKNLVNGLLGRLEVPCGEYEALVIPKSAVREVGQLYLVDVLDDEGYPLRRFVTLGREHNDMVEVLSGLQPNEEVIVNE